MSHFRPGAGVPLPDWDEAGVPLRLADSLRRTVALMAFIVAGAAVMLFAAERLAGIVEVQLPFDEHCDAARGACATTLPGGGEIRFAALRRAEAAGPALRLQVVLGAGSADDVEVDLSGVNMRMTADRQRLTAEAPGRYAADVELPVCSAATMIWEAAVRVRSSGQRYVARYRFSSSAH